MSAHPEWCFNSYPEFRGFRWLISRDGVTQALSCRLFASRPEAALNVLLFWSEIERVAFSVAPVDGRFWSWEASLDGIPLASSGVYVGVDEAQEAAARVEAQVPGMPCRIHHP